MKVEFKKGGGFVGMHYYMVVGEDYYSLTTDPLYEMTEEKALEQAAIILGNLIRKGDITFEHDRTV